jgi:hypothetical protein
MQNISIMPKNKIGDSSIQPFPVRAFHQQNGAVLQGVILKVDPF